MEGSLREQALASTRNFKRKDAEAFGIKMQLRQLSAGAVKDIALRQDKADPSIHANVWWIIGTAFDPETNQRIFEWSDAEGINGLFVGDVNALADQAIELNSANKTTEDAAKNS